MRIFYALLLCCAAAVPCWAGRPLSTEDAYNVGARSLEAEFGFDYVMYDGGKELGPCFVATYGLLSFLDVAAEVPVIITSPDEGDGETGIGDVAVRAKAVLYGNEEAGPTFAVVPEVKLATGDEEKGLGCGSNDFGALGVVSYAAGRLTLHGNVGYAYAKPKEGDGEGVACAAAAAEVAAFGPVTLAGEFLAELKKEEPEEGSDEDGKYPMAAGGGVSFAVLENLALDAGVTVGLGAADGETVVTAGATWGVF
jgi:opacity protein-like surface antigen